MSNDLLEVMGFLDFFHFDSAEYALELEDVSDSELISRFNTITRKMTAHTASVAVHATAAPATAGLTTIGVGFSYRQIRILVQRGELIEAECKRRGLGDPRVRGRDVGLGLLTMGVKDYAKGIFS